MLNIYYYYTILYLVEFFEWIKNKKSEIVQLTHTQTEWVCRHHNFHLIHSQVGIVDGRMDVREGEGGWGKSALKSGRSLPNPTVVLHFFTMRAHFDFFIELEQLASRGGSALELGS